MIDILQPDVGHGGGITQVKKVSTLAEAHHVPIAPHCTMSYLGLTASFHLSAAVPVFLIHEGYENVLPAGVAHKTWEMDEEGYVSLPEGPGLGSKWMRQRLSKSDRIKADASHGPTVDWQMALSPIIREKLSTIGALCKRAI